MQKKNILFILPWLPYPLNSGGRQAIFNGIFAIKEHYNVFITYSEDSSNSADQEAFSELMDNKVNILPYFQNIESESRNLIQRIAGKLSRGFYRFSGIKPKPTNPYSYWIEELLPKSKGYITHINNIIAKYDIDLVQCEMLRNLAFIQSLPKDVKTVFVHHELGFVRHELELSSISNDNYDGQAICNCSKNLEISQLNQYDCVVTLSPIDSKKLQESGVKTDIKTSFAIVNTSKELTVSTDNSHELTFIGPDNHEPNLLGIRWFLENCWEDLQKKDNDYHLTVIGKWSQPNIKALSAQYPNISFSGFVDDLPAALRNTIMIVPILIGSGIRMEILEASNIGVPFVSTTVGAEGIPAVSGEHCLIADSPSDFVNAILQMKDEKLRNKFILNANKMVKDHFSMDALRQNRLGIYASL